MKSTAYYYWIPALFVTLLCLIVFVAGLGYIAIKPSDILQILLSFTGQNLSASIDPSFPFVILEVRLPRILTASIVGGGLAVAGCVFQSLLQNPLADPYTLGISSGAAFGASVAIFLNMIGILLPAPYLIPLCAFAGGLATLYAVFSLSGPSSRLSPRNTVCMSSAGSTPMIGTSAGMVRR